MSFTEKKREEIKKYILRKITLDDADVIAKTKDNFGISLTSVKRYLQEIVDSGAVRKAEERNCGYCLAEQIFSYTVSLAEKRAAEDELYASYIVGHLDHCNEKARRIWQYTCAEILNNAIEHAQGNKLYIEVRTNMFYVAIVVVDDGIGTFHTLLTYMKAHGWEDPGIEEALVELYKGKITSREENHSGEGIFFSGKMLDEFALWSDNCIYKYGAGKNPETIQSHLLSYASRMEKVGTMVLMRLENETERNIEEVFNMYTDIDEGFVKTKIPVKEACINGEPVARSQARRICNRLETFKEVILDFQNVEFMGQGFADEIFRVFAIAHPQVVLHPVNMLPVVARMIRHVSRGTIPENICLEQ